MSSLKTRNDWLTAASIGLLTMCVVTVDHEALGHGSACLLLHGRIELLTSSLFRCSVRSGWIDPAGPFANLLIGTLALLCLRRVPQRLVMVRLFLILLSAFSYFWEGGYLVRAMIKREGDLYFFAEFLMGSVSASERCLAIAGGLALYVATVRLTDNALKRLWPDAQTGRTIARTAWTAATAGAATAALAYSGHGWGNLKDAVLEIGAASFPLLLIPYRPLASGERAPVYLVRRPSTIALSAAVYVVFVHTLGKGIVS